MRVLSPQKIGVCKIESHGAVLVHPIFWKLRFSKEVKKLFFEIVELIDPNTGILSQTYSDGRSVPLSKSQINVFVESRVAGKALDELVAYGVLARVSVSRTEFYVANPYVVNKGEKINPFLLAIFNKVTLRKTDKYDANFDLSLQAQYDSFWEEMFEEDSK